MLLSTAGVRCETLCPRGNYGEECQHECDCSNDSSCNQENANCTCSRGWTGSKCNTPCKPGKYGFGCKEECPERPSDGKYMTYWITILYRYSLYLVMLEIEKKVIYKAEHIFVDGLNILHLDKIVYPYARQIRLG